MKLATIERIEGIAPHPNADRLELATVGGYQCIVPKDQHVEGEMIVFIEPDAVLPAEAPWAEPVYGYTSKGRVKAARLRGLWSMGLVMPLDILGEPLETPEPGLSVADRLGVVKYEPPLPKDLKAKGPLPFGIPKTDEENWQRIPDELMPWGHLVDVTLKVDGSSFTAYCALPQHTGQPEVAVGICSRTLELKIDDGMTNPWLEAARKTSVLDGLRKLCEGGGASLALRGEVYGEGVQSSSINPHARRARGVAFFSVWNIAERRYENPKGGLGYASICEALGLEAVPVIEVDVPLTRGLLDGYGDELKKIDGEPFEGVVLKGADGWSCKVVNKHYDSRK